MFESTCKSALFLGSIATALNIVLDVKTNVLQDVIFPFVVRTIAALWLQNCAIDSMIVKTWAMNVVVDAGMDCFTVTTDPVYLLTASVTE